MRRDPLTREQMKQRNQTPDLYTYNILLWGLSIHPDPPWALEHAAKLYQRMAAPGSNTPPNHVNTHLLLQLCGRARDLDRLWEVVGMIPETGPGAPSETTYTVILTALRTVAEDPIDAGAAGAEEGDGVEELYPRGAGEVRQAARNRAVDSGRRVWAALIGGWRAGTVRMDARLVFAMGRLLALGDRPRDRADLFRLVAQTVGVPAPPGLLQPGGAQQQAEAPPVGGAHFDPALLFASSPADEARLARPSNHILSLALDASAALPDAAAGPAADHYWSQLTGPPFGLTPDTVSLKNSLRVLSRGRDSARAARALRELDAKAAPDRGTFRAALTACLRNARAGTGLRDALAVCAVRRARLPAPDPVALDMLLRTVDAGAARAPAEAGAALAAICGDVAAAVRRRELGPPAEVEDLVVSGRGPRAAAGKAWPELVGGAGAAHGPGGGGGRAAGGGVGGGQGRARGVPRRAARGLVRPDAVVTGPPASICWVCRTRT